MLSELRLSKRELKCMPELQGRRGTVDAKLTGELEGLHWNLTN